MIHFMYIFINNKWNKLKSLTKQYQSWRGGRDCQESWAYREEPPIHPIGCCTKITRWTNKLSMVFQILCTILPIWHLWTIEHTNRQTLFRKEQNWYRKRLKCCWRRWGRMLTGQCNWNLYNCFPIQGTC